MNKKSPPPTTTLVLLDLSAIAAGKIRERTKQIKEQKDKKGGQKSGPKNKAKKAKRVRPKTRQKGGQKSGPKNKAKKN